MSREFKRVPLDFEWPLNKVWYGYMLNACADCEACKEFAKIKGLKFRESGCPDYADWVDPPKGNGWQMWETTSEGSPISPISPVFETLKTLESHEEDKK